MHPPSHSWWIQLRVTNIVCVGYTVVLGLRKKKRLSACDSIVLEDGERLEALNSCAGGQRGGMWQLPKYRIDSQEFGRTYRLRLLRAFTYTFDRSSRSSRQIEHL